MFSGIGHCFGDEAIRIDIDPKTKPTIVADVRYLPLRPGLKPDLLHGSPPCKYLSYARYLQASDNYQGIAESLELVAAFFKAIEYLEPKWWTLENPVGTLHKLFSHTRIIYKAHDYVKKKTDFYSNNRSLKRAIIPKEVGQAILEACIND